MECEPIAALTFECPAGDYLRTVKRQLCWLERRSAPFVVMVERPKPSRPMHIRPARFPGAKLIEATRHDIT
jgi:hypothetical protein